MIFDETHCGNCFCKALTWCLGAPERGWVGNGHLSDSYLSIDQPERETMWTVHEEEADFNTGHQSREEAFQYI